jgi:hypothetical protein
MLFATGASNEMVVCTKEPAMARKRFSGYVHFMLAAGLLCGVGAREASAQAALGVYETGDFNGDGYSDIGDYWQASGQFWIRVNYANGLFELPGTWSGGTGNTVTPTAGWEVLVGDFNGDGWADYADRYVANGDIYIHTNNHNGTWQPSGTQWGQGTTLAGANIETLVGDIDGDGRADLIQRDRSSGMLWKLFNNGPGVGTFIAGAATASPWLTQTTNWKLLVADFTGDGFVDLAEMYVPNGDIYIHQNMHTSNWIASGFYAGAMLMPAGATWDIIVGHFNGAFNPAGYAIVKKSGSYFGQPNGWFEVHQYSNVTNTFAPVSSGSGFYSSTPGFSVFGQKVAF